MLNDFGWAPLNKTLMFHCRDTCSTQQKAETGSTSDDVLRLEYSMAIVRMVNGISDKAQKGRMATSVAHNAAAAGKPYLQSCRM